MRIFILMLLAIASSSCYNGVQYLTDVGDTLTTETTTIFVINPANTTGGTLDTEIFINGYAVGRIGRNTHLKTTVAVGGDREVSIRTEARPNGNYTFPAPPNSVHYFEYETDPREDSPSRPLLRKLSEEDGRLLLAQVPGEVVYRPKKSQ